MPSQVYSNGLDYYAPGTRRTLDMENGESLNLVSAKYQLIATIYSTNATMEKADEYTGQCVRVRRRTAPLLDFVQIFQKCAEYAASQGMSLLQNSHATVSVLITHRGTFQARFSEHDWTCY
jgi:hypothetical protein